MIEMQSWQEITLIYLPVNIHRRVRAFNSIKVNLKCINKWLGTYKKNFILSLFITQYSIFSTMSSVTYGILNIQIVSMIWWFTAKAINKCASYPYQRLWPSSVTLNSSWHRGKMGSTKHLVEVIVELKKIPKLVYDL